MSPVPFLFVEVGPEHRWKEASDLRSFMIRMLWGMVEIHTNFCVLCTLQHKLFRFAEVSQMLYGELFSLSP